MTRNIQDAMFSALANSNSPMAAMLIESMPEELRPEFEDYQRRQGQGGGQGPAPEMFGLGGDIPAEVLASLPPELREQIEQAQGNVAEVEAQEEGIPDFDELLQQVHPDLAELAYNDLYVDFDDVRKAFNQGAMRNEPTHCGVHGCEGCEAKIRLYPLFRELYRLQDAAIDGLDADLTTSPEQEDEVRYVLQQVNSMLWDADADNLVSNSNAQNQPAQVFVENGVVVRPVPFYSTVLVLNELGQIHEKITSFTRAGVAIQRGLSDFAMSGQEEALEPISNNEQAQNILNSHLSEPIRQARRLQRKDERGQGLSDALQPYEDALDLREDIKEIVSLADQPMPVASIIMAFCQLQEDALESAINEAYKTEWARKLIKEAVSEIQAEEQLFRTLVPQLREVIEFLTEKHNSIMATIPRKYLRRELNGQAPAIRIPLEQLDGALNHAGLIAERDLEPEQVEKALDELQQIHVAGIEGENAGATAQQASNYRFILHETGIEPANAEWHKQRSDAYGQVTNAGVNTDNVREIVSQASELQNIGGDVGSYRGRSRRLPEGATREKVVEISRQSAELQEIGHHVGSWKGGGCGTEAHLPHGATMEKVQDISGQAAELHRIGEKLEVTTGGFCGDPVVLKSGAAETKVGQIATDLGLTTRELNQVTDELSQIGDAGVSAETVVEVALKAQERDELEGVLATASRKKDDSLVDAAQRAVKYAHQKKSLKKREQPVQEEAAAEPRREFSPC